MPAARSSTRSPGRGSTASTTTRAPATVLAQRQHVVGEVVAARHVVEHRGDVGGLLVEVGTGHGVTLCSGAHGLPAGRAPSRRLPTVTSPPAPRARPGPGLRGGPPRRAHRPRSTTPARCWRCCPTTPTHRLGTPRRGPRRLGRRRRCCRTTGADRFARRPGLVDRARPGTPWSATRSTQPGTGLVCFGSFAFADEPGDSVLVVPEVVVGRRGGTTWVTTIGVGAIPAPPPLRPADAPAGPRGVTFADGALSAAPSGSAVVAEAVRRINAGDLEKVVLARDLLATARHGHRRALAAAPAGRELPDVLDLPRRRPVRGDAGDAGPPRARAGHLARAGRHHPSYRRRRPRPGPGRHAGPVVEGPRGARVRRPLGGRRARPALHVDERARGAVRAAPAQRHAPGHRRRRGGPRRRRPGRPRWSSPRRCTRPRRSAAPPPTWPPR